jgi:ABC-2 type transport system permease protein
VSTNAAAETPRRFPFRTLLRTEGKLFLREPAALFWAIAFPLVLTIVFGIATSGNRPDPKLGGQRLVDVYVPVMMAFVLTILAIQALPAALASYREKGVLRRMSTTPVPAWLLLAADVAINAVVAVFALALIAVVARVAFSVRLPHQVVGFIITLVLGGIAMLSLGAVVAAVAWSVRAASAIGTLLFFPMMFFAGLWIPRQSMSSGLRTVSDYTPLGAMVGAVQDTMRGSWPHPVHLVVLAAYAVVLPLAASRLFRWE